MLARARFVHAVKAVEDVRPVGLRDADAGVGHGQDALLAARLDAHGHASARKIILDGVFHEVKDDVVNVVLRCAHGHAVAHETRERHVALGRQRAQQMQRPVHGLLQIDDRHVRLHAVVAARQVEQLLGRALQALGLTADVGHEFAHRLAVHVRALRDAVRQQTDRRQRRLELVRCVGYEPAALRLGRLEALGEVVEFAPELGQLVVARERQAKAVVAALHGAHAVGKLRDAPREHLDRKPQHHERGRADADRDRGEAALDAADECRALAVALAHVHRADGLAAAHDGHGRAAEKRLARVVRVEYGLSVERAHELGIERVLAADVVFGRGVIHGQPRAVGHDDARQVTQIEQREHLPGVVRREVVEQRQGGGHDGGAVGERALLFGEHDVARGARGVGVDEREQDRHEHRERHGEAKLHT